MSYQFGTYSSDLYSVSKSSKGVSLFAEALSLQLEAMNYAVWHTWSLWWGTVVEDMDYLTCMHIHSLHLQIKSWSQNGLCKPATMTENPTSLHNSNFPLKYKNKYYKIILRDFLNPLVNDETKLKSSDLQISYWMVSKKTSSKCVLWALVYIMAENCCF